MYAFIQDVPIKEDIYDKIRGKLGSEPPAGLIIHLALRREDDKLRYVDVWQDKASCDAAFASRIHPAVSSVFRELGFKPEEEPIRQETPVVHVWLGKA
jgi:hypothetical protein